MGGDTKTLSIGGPNVVYSEFMSNHIEPADSKEQREAREAADREREERSSQEPAVDSSPSLISDDSATIVGSSSEQCVIFAKRYTGITRSIGYAGSATSQGAEPKIGSIALERRYGHAMVVTAIADDGIEIIEANYIKGAITTRFIPYWDVRGYIYD